MKFILDRFISEKEVANSLPSKYEMNLNKDDMMIVLKALHNDSTEEAEMLLRDIFETLNLK
jgi:hypothetical protein